MPVWIGPDLSSMPDKQFFEFYNEVLKEAVKRLKSKKKS